MAGISNNKISDLSSHSAVAVLLSFAFLAANLERGLAARLNPAAGRTSEFIKTSCRATSYPALCVSSLAGYASAIQTSPTLIAHAALSVSLDGAKSTAGMMSKLSTGAGLKPRDIAAMKDCVETVRDSVDEIKKSIGEMGQLAGKDVGLHINNMQTWVSAALTEEETCMDGFAFAGMNVNLKNAVRAKIEYLAHTTSNALSLVNALASTQSAALP